MTRRPRRKGRAAGRYADGLPARVCGHETLAFLLALNQAVAEREKAGEPVTAPGLPPCVEDPKPFITDDCIRVDEN